MNNRKHSAPRLCLAFHALITSARPSRTVATALSVALLICVPVQAAPVAAVPQLDDMQAAELHRWYRAVGPRRVHETFGNLVVRAGMYQLGKPYVDPAEHAGVDGVERMTVELRSFQCVSFVEFSLALARCVWQGKNNPQHAAESCFLRQIERQRYRHGKRTDYTSRLHYFHEWMVDNDRRGLVRNISADLGGQSRPFRFDFMTTHAKRYPPLGNPQILKRLRSIEQALSQKPVAVAVGATLATGERSLLDGDIVGIVGNKPGLLISHTALIHVDGQGQVHVLHASSYQKRVLLTRAGIANYIHRRPERRGIIAARPLAAPL